MHPQRTLIESAEMISLSEVLERLAGPNIRHWTMNGGFQLGPENSSHKEHGDVFPNQTFTGLSKNEKSRTERAPASSAWGRYDSEAHELHMITQSGSTPHGMMRNAPASRSNRDIDNRLDALSSIEQHFKDHSNGPPNISHGVNGKRDPQSIERYRKSLMGEYQ